MKEGFEKPKENLTEYLEKLKNKIRKVGLYGVMIGGLFVSCEDNNSHLSNVLREHQIKLSVKEKELEIKKKYILDRIEDIKNDIDRHVDLNAEEKKEFDEIQTQTDALVFQFNKMIEDKKDSMSTRTETGWQNPEFCYGNWRLNKFSGKDFSLSTQYPKDNNVVSEAWNYIPFGGMFHHYSNLSKEKGKGENIMYKLSDENHNNIPTIEMSYYKEEQNGSFKQTDFPEINAAVSFPSWKKDMIKFQESIRHELNK